MTAGKLLQLIGFGRDSRIRTLGRGIGLAALVGIVSGSVAVLFHALCLFVAHFAMGMGIGYEEGGPAHESTIEAFGLEPLHPTHIVPWMLLLVPTIGGLISGLLTWPAPEARGSGTDPAINAYHHKGGFIRRRVPVIKMFASAITLGTGGSGGQEGPIAQMGAGVGSWIATRLGLSDYERRILMTAGLGAGIGALFHAPLAGAIFAIEVLYRDPEFESEALIPAFIATTMAYCVYSLAYGFGGFQPLFSVNHESLQVAQPLLLLPPLTLLAIVMSALSLLFVRATHGSYAMFGRLRVPTPIKPAIGGLAVGSLALAAYAATVGLGPDAQHDALSVLSIGYGFLQEVLADQLSEAHGAAVAILLIVGLGKLVTTSLTIGSGGAAGSFGPSMVIGGAMGAALALILHHWVPDLVERDDLVIYAILGMAGFFAATAKTPVSSLIMASEVTNSYALLLPSMWVCAIAYLTSRNWTLYREQVNSRLQSPAHRSDFFVDVLRGATVGSALTDAHRQFITVSLDTPIDQVSRMITGTLQSSFPVVDPEGRYRGLFDLDDVRQFLYESQLGHLAVAEDLADESVEPLTLTTDLSAAMSRFAQGHFDELPVVEHADSTKILAMLRRQDVLTAYDKRVVEMRG